MNDVALKELGLTDSETKVYLALLDVGDASRGAIVARSGIAGSKIYEVLERLQEKGLAATYLKDGVHRFKATSPNQLLAYLEEKRAALAIVETDVRRLLPALLARHAAPKTTQEVELVTGLKGFGALFREQVALLDKGECTYVIGGTSGSDEADVVAFFQKIHEMREAKGIRTRMLYNKRQRTAVSAAFGSVSYPHTETRYIDHAAPVAINIYRDHTVITVYDKTPIAIHVRSAAVAQSFREHFEQLWEIAQI